MASRRLVQCLSRRIATNTGFERLWRVGRRLGGEEDSREVGVAGDLARQVTDRLMAPRRRAAGLECENIGMCSGTSAGRGSLPISGLHSEIGIQIDSDPEITATSRWNKDQRLESGILTPGDLGASLRHKVNRLIPDKPRHFSRSPGQPFALLLPTVPLLFTITPSYVFGLVTLRHTQQHTHAPASVQR